MKNCFTANTCEIVNEKWKFLKIKGNMCQKRGHVSLKIRLHIMFNLYVLKWYTALTLKKFFVKKPPILWENAR